MYLFGNEDPGSFGGRSRRRGPVPVGIHGSACLVNACRPIHVWGPMNAEDRGAIDS